MSELAEILASTPWLLAGCVFVLGLLVGSFLNVVIHRLPIMLEREWQAQARELLAESAAARDAQNSQGDVLITAGPAAVLDAGADSADSAPLSTVAVDELLSQPAAYAAPTDAAPTAATPGPTIDAAIEAAPAPEPYNLVVPRSRCPRCNAEITALQNIPVVSWLALGGKCANCRAPISARYPLVELLTAVLSAAVALHFGWHWQLLGALVLTWSLVALTAIDLDHTLLPDAITLPLLWLGLLVSLFWHPGPHALHIPVMPRSAVAGAIAGYLLLWSVYWAFKLVTGKEGMGYGDFKLLAALGAWLGWQMLPLILLLSALAGAVVGIALIVIRGRDRNVPMPFGPYLAAAGWIALMWGPQLNGGYLAFAGLGP